MPTATPMLPAPERATVRVRDHHADPIAEGRLERGVDALCRRVGIERHEERGGLAAVGVRSVDRCVRRHEPEAVANQQCVRHRAHDLGGFAEDELHELRILLGELGKLSGAGRRLDGAEVDRAALRFRDDLAGDHDDVAGLRLEPGLGEDVDHHGREVVAGLHHRDPGHADERVTVGASMVGM